jgi:hypothetical protein
MELKEIADTISQVPPHVVDIAIISIILSCIQISPLKLNPWTWLKSFIELPARLSELEKKVDMNELFHWRSMILSRADHVRQGSKLSKERWNHTIDTIDDYERTCKILEEKYGKEFKNGKAKAAIHYLKKKHEVVYAKNDYLIGEDYMEEEEEFNS